MKLSCFMEPRSLQSDLGLRTWENIKVDIIRKLKFSYFDDKTFNNNLISYGFSESEVLQNNWVKSLKRKINRKNQENSFWRHNLDPEKWKKIGDVVNERRGRTVNSLKNLASGHFRCKFLLVTEVSSNKHVASKWQRIFEISILTGRFWGDIVMEELETNAGDSEIISFNETITIWTEVETMENISEPNPILPAYIAYTSFVLFRYLQFLKENVLIFFNFLLIQAN